MSGASENQRGGVAEIVSVARPAPAQPLDQISRSCGRQRRPPAATVVARRVCTSIRGHSEFEVDAVALRAILRCRCGWIRHKLPVYGHAEGRTVSPRPTWTDWRKLAQGLHARYVVDDFGTGARFVAAGEAGDALGHHSARVDRQWVRRPQVISDDAIYRDAEGTEHVVEWVTQQDVDLARRHHRDRRGPQARRRPGLGQPHRARRRHGALRDHRPSVGRPADRERRGGPSGVPSDEIRDATGRVPNLWFGTPTSTRPRVSGSTSRSMGARGSRATHRRRSPRAGPSSMKATRPRSPCSPTRTATRESYASTCPLRRRIEPPTRVAQVGMLSSSTPKQPRGGLTRRVPVKRGSSAREAAVLVDELPRRPGPLFRKQERHQARDVGRGAELTCRLPTG